MPKWSEEHRALLKSGKSTRELMALVGRSRSAVIVQRWRLSTPIVPGPPRESSKPPRYCVNCGKQVKRYHRRCCSIACRWAVHRREFPPEETVRRRKAYLAEYTKRPEVVARYRLLGKARREAKKRKTTIRDVLVDWGEDPDWASGDYREGVR
jgi:hypothetical protein